MHSQMETVLARIRVLLYAVISADYMREYFFFFSLWGVVIGSVGYTWKKYGTSHTFEPSHKEY